MAKGEAPMEEAPEFLEEGRVAGREGGQRDCLQGALAHGAHCFPLGQTCTGANVEGWGAATLLWALPPSPEF